jgi:hypothetical protein
LGGKDGDFLEDILAVAGGTGDITDPGGVLDKLLKRLTAVGTDEFVNRHVYSEVRGIRAEPLIDIALALLIGTNSI